MAKKNDVLSDLFRLIQETLVNMEMASAEELELMSVLLPAVGVIAKAKALALQVHTAGFDIDANVRFKLYRTLRVELCGRLASLEDRLAQFGGEGGIFIPALLSLLRPEETVVGPFFAEKVTSKAPHETLDD